MIDLSSLHSRTEEEIVLQEEYELPKDYYQNTDIQELSILTVDGKILYKENEEGEFSDYFVGTIQGEMILPDSISLENISYPFKIEYDDFISEKCIKNENMLDIFEFLWENTVLEVPLQFTKVQDLSKVHGDGWKVVREEDCVNTNNPFRELLEDYKKE